MLARTPESQRNPRPDWIEIIKQALDKRIERKCAPLREEIEGLREEIKALRAELRGDVRIRNQIVNGKYKTRVDIP